jgi:hypothetical protein
MPNDDPMQRPDLGHNAAPGAVVVLAALVLLLIGAGYFALRGLGGAGERLASGAGKLIDQAKQAVAPASPDNSAVEQTPATPAVSTPDQQTPPPPVPPRPDAALAQLRHAVDQCVPTLIQFASEVRVIAIDASRENVDFIQESSAKPGRYVRMGCRWNGRDYDVSEWGRMVVPKRVGDVAALPKSPIDPGELQGDWYAARIAQAAKALKFANSDSVQRVELAYVQGRGRLTRVRFEAGGERREVVLDGNDRALAADIFFPQVERTDELSDEAAERGFRDQGEVIWSSGVGSSLDELGKDFFPPQQPLRALNLVGRTVLAFVADPKAPDKTQAIAVNEYKERQPPENAEASPRYCARPFTLAQARAALGEAKRQRNQSDAAFEQIQFESAIVDCADDPNRPGWHFEGGDAR